ncbi:unnamed protein product [Fusarium equiseti]|uniref:Uncharacterized protein n=1 Tax=Fusarium equiseti TaxID=61235 RepID=A0A8J2ISZ0_FUSEQ|nr:unnamed protein product [Fusarium equiseti]
MASPLKILRRQIATGLNIMGALKHHRLPTQCGICAQTIEDADDIVPLLGSDLNPEMACCLDRTTLVKFSEGDVTEITIGGKVLCWSANCFRCKAGSEVMSLHTLCLAIFQKNCKIDRALDRLWTTVGQSNTWKGAPVLRLDRQPTLAVDLVREKAEVYGITMLGELPAELIHSIHKYSNSAKLWHCIAALSLAREISQLQPDISPPITDVPLREVLAWTRGNSSVELTKECPPYALLTLDSRGICKIEKLQERPPYQPRRSDKQAFIILHEDEFQDVTVTSKIWDTPSPPSLEDCEIHGRVSSSLQLKTVDLRGVSGLTFFFAFNRMQLQPSNAFPEDGSLMLKVTSNGQISTLQKPWFLIRTRLAGDISIGMFHSGAHKDIVLSQSSPELFIYSAADVGPATIFGTYPREGQKREISPPFPDSWSASPSFIPHVHCYSAPLDNVSCMHVLEDDGGKCNGFLLEYNDGAQRALGNCRLGVDRMVKYWKPSRICLMGGPQGSPRLPMSYVEAGNDDEHEHELLGWTCNPCHGVLEFWFSKDLSIIRVVE